MFKNIAGVGIPNVMGIAGGEINMAKQEAQVLATILNTTVRLQFNNDTYLIDRNGGCVKESGELDKILKMIDEEQTY